MRASLLHSKVRLASILVLGLGLSACGDGPQGSVSAASCASKETVAALAEIIFDDVRKNYSGEVKYVNDMAKMFTAEVEMPTLEKIDKDVKKAECEGRIILKIATPYYEAFNREKTLSADVGYTVQPSADGSGFVYTLGGYEEVLRLLIQGVSNIAEKSKPNELISANSVNKDIAHSSGNDISNISEALSPDQADSSNFWSHNGSVVKLYASGNKRSFYYEKPRAGLPVSEGQLLFYGFRDGANYTGTANRFSSKCGTVSYAVSGTVAPSQTMIRLTGMAPKRDQNCNIVGEFKDELVFQFLHQ